jgi:membrane protease YdiL (CAAX protease family)
MNLKFISNHPYWAAILAGLICTFFTAFGMAIPQILGFGIFETYLFAAFIILFSGILGIIILRNSFLHIIPVENKKVLFYIPLFLIEIFPIIFGNYNNEMTILQYFILLFFTIAVGINEEIYFRGIALKILNKRGIKKAIIVSSIIFGILHIVNLFNGKDVLYIVFQICFALLVGFVLSEVVIITKSLIIVIIWHFLHDFLALITGDSLGKEDLIILAIQIVIMLVYAIFIWREECFIPVYEIINGDNCNKKL